jgi:membrane dipeptidase
VQALRARYGLPPEAGTDYDGAFNLPAEQRDRFIDELVAQQPKASLKDYVDQIDYVAKRIGVDHVGIGTDFNHGAGVIGFNDESEAPNVTAELVERGYTQDQIAAIWGGNFLRVLSEAQSKAKQ